MQILPPHVLSHLHILLRLITLLLLLLLFLQLILLFTRTGLSDDCMEDVNVVL